MINDAEQSHGDRRGMAPEQMTKHKIVNIILSIVSVSASAIFIFAGIMMVQNDPPAWILVFGLGTIVYGLLNVVLLALAWLRGGKAVQKVTLCIATAFLIAFIMASLDVGMISGLEWLGIIIVAVMVWVNYFTIRRLVLRKTIA